MFDSFDGLRSRSEVACVIDVERDRAHREVRFDSSSPAVYPGSDVDAVAAVSTERGPKPTATTVCAAPLSSSFTFEGCFALLAMSAEGVFAEGARVRRP